MKCYGVTFTGVATWFQWDANDATTRI